MISKSFYSPKSITILIASLLLVQSTVFSQHNPQKQTFTNPDFIKYTRDKRNGKLVTHTNDGYPLGGMPSQLIQPKNPYRKISKTRSQDLPARYDLRAKQLVSPVKDQSPFGSCWAFASIGAIESRWMKLGYGTYDLSEHHLGTCAGWEYGIDGGGNALVAGAYFTRLEGPVHETDDPYSDKTTCINRIFTPEACVTELFYLPTEHNSVKQSLMKFGALAVSMHMAPNQYQYYNPRDKTYYYTGEDYANHDVLLVGWDDNKTVTGGRLSPQTKGAWIIKNSWGSLWGEGGYFYIAYDDTKILTNVYCYPSRFDYSNELGLYTYDELGFVNRFELTANRALVKFNAPDKEFINRITIYAFVPGTVIDIEIFNSKNGNQLTGLLGSAYHLVCGYQGYHTFDIPAVVEGDFYVKLTYNTPGMKYMIPVEMYLENKVHANIEKDVAWISSDDENWQPVGEGIENKEYDICLKVFTKNTDKPVAFFTTDKEQVCIGAPVSFTENAFNVTGEYHWNFGDGANPPVATGAGPHEVIYSNQGEKKITLQVENENGTDTQEKKINVGEKLDVMLITDRWEVTLGKDAILTALADADNYKWSGAEGLHETNGQTVKVTPPAEGIYTYEVTAKQGACSGTDWVKLEVNQGPDNDDVCNATELKYGENGPFTNRFASTEYGEPMPQKVDCEEPMAWCDEGGLQNSIWFSFTADESQVAAFDTKGFDNQIAIYQANSCEDLLSGNYELIAANDDYYGEDKDFAAVIEKIDNLKVGDTYWVQIDGSAGGATGTCNITLYNKPFSSIQEPKFTFFENQPFVYPNPNSGSFFIEYDFSNQKQPVYIQIFNINGQILKQQIIEAQSVGNQKVDLSTYGRGIYHIRFITSQRLFNRKIIIE